MALHFHRLTVRNIRKETNDCVSVSFDIPEYLKNDYRFKHGQNITIKAVLGGQEIRRSYSICNSPVENELRIAIKRVPGGAFSAFANEKLKRGDVLDVMPPSGNFFTELNIANRKHYVFFAAGSGITPIVSIIKTILILEPESSVTLLYGNKNVSSIIFKETLEALKDIYLERFSLTFILSRERTEADITYGRIDADKCARLDKLIDLYHVDEFFICGPENMIFEIKEFLEKKGIVNSKIHFELFTTPTPKYKRIFTSAKAENGESLVTVKLDGRSFEFHLDYESNTILDSALACGADLPFSCKGGVCTTCKARVLEGQVEMEVNYGLEPDEVKAGFILTCQAHPRSKMVVVDFDVKS